jgi:GDP-4-dehydro-6-deoxy-D-mannose reductase
MRILITGCNGFSAKHLIAYLKFNDRNNDIWGIDIEEDKGGLEPEIHYVQCDLGNLEMINQAMKLIRPDKIFHLASQSGNQHTLSFLLERNVVSTAHLLESAKENANPNCIILIISSSAVYGIQQDKDKPVAETSEIRPVTLYGISKYTLEMVSMRYFLEHGMDIKIIRPFNLIGKGISDSLFVGQVLKQIHALKEAKKYNGEIQVGYVGSKRDYLDISDAVRAYDILSSNGKSGEVYNIGSGQSISMRDLLYLLVSKSGLRVGCFEKQDTPGKNDIPNQVADIAKAGKVGWWPQISIDRTMSNLFD